MIKPPAGPWIINRHREIRMYEIILGIGALLLLLLLAVCIAVGVVAIAGKWLWVLLLIWIGWRLGRARAWW